MPHVPGTMVFTFYGSGLQSLHVTRKQGGLAQVRQTRQLHDETLQPDGKPAMRRHAKAECLQVARYGFLCHATRFQSPGIVFELVETLPTSDQLSSPEQKVKRVGVLGVVRVRRRIERTLHHRVPGHEQEIGLEGPVSY